MGGKLGKRNTKIYYTMNKIMMFRELTEQEQKEFKEWARKNYAPHSKIDELWHPVIKHECLKINAENK